jgi:hypothetical protein
MYIDVGPEPLLASTPTCQWCTQVRAEQSSREHHAMMKVFAARGRQQLKDIMTLHTRRPKNQ